MTAVLTIIILAGLFGMGLGFAASRFKVDVDPVADQVNQLLPQTQCAQCGYPGCRPYAEAIDAGTAAINLCPPGGDDTVRRLANLLGREPEPLAETAVAMTGIALIDEDLCIGCTHCRSACPVDAIVGAHQLMHTVIASECTGCELCLAPCPVDCISMEAA